MGVGVSGWRLARTVASLGQLGVVSGTASAVTMARRLALGDADGAVRGALDRFPFPDVARRVVERHLDVSGPAGARFRGIPRPTLDPGPALVELTVVANFVEVALAKAGHDGLVGINYLEKIQLPTLPSLYGAMLAGVDYVLMGAGVPSRIPAVLDRLARNEPTTLPVTVVGASRDDDFSMTFDPRVIIGSGSPPSLERPRFLAIVSSASLATFLARNASGSPDGFVVELPTAGGHNAPPRGRMTVDEDGQPVYGPRDHVDLAAFAALDRPYWAAGGFASPEGLRSAQEAGAVGIQVGTAFAFCEESGLDPALREQALAAVVSGRASVRTDPVASPTGYPFKLARLDGTLSERDPYEARPRTCDLGYLREPYKRDDGRVDYRCAAEPVQDYIRKGGDVEDTHGRRCLCNALVADIGLGQVRRDGYVEPPLLTAGDDLVDLGRFLTDGQTSYTARDVIDHLLARQEPTVDIPSSAGQRG